MTVELFEKLIASPALNAAMELAPSEATFLSCFDKLRKRFDSEIAKAAIEQAILRAKAKEKFPDAAKLFFEREALEQATHHLVSAQRAIRFRNYKTLLDLGCGLGADSIALARAGCRVIAVERDPLRVRLARANFEALGLAIGVREADGLAEPSGSLSPASGERVRVRGQDSANEGRLFTGEAPPHPNPLPPQSRVERERIDAVFCDPARRTGDKRFLALEAYSPSPREVIARFQKPLAFKLAPGLDRREVDAFEGESEFVSLNGDLKECRLWLGELATARYRATVLPANESLFANEVVYDRELSSAMKYLYLPDAAVVRARLEPQLAERLNAKFMDATQPLLTSDTLTQSPFAVVFQIDSVITGSIAKLREALSERNVGRVTWHNIGSPREVEEVRRVKLRGDEHCHVILTKLDDHAAAIITRAAAAGTK